MTRRTAKGTAPPAPPEPVPQDEAVLVAHGRPRRLDITVVHGDIVDVRTRALVLGVFRSVDPAGAAAAVDRHLGGALRDLVISRAFSAEAGTVFVLPTPRTGLRAEMVVLLGLGSFDRFEHAVVQMATSNLIRTLVRGGVDDCALVPLGGGSGSDVGGSTQHLLRGVLASLSETDTERRFRELTICELDPAKFTQVSDELYRGCREPFCRDFDLAIRTIAQPARAPERGAPAAVLTATDAPVYLLVRGDVAGTSLVLRCSVLTAGAKAAIIEGSCATKLSVLKKELAGVEAESFTPSALEAFGDRLARLALAPRVQQELKKLKGRHVAVVHDLEAARLPWEALRIDGWAPALQRGMSRRYLADDYGVARWAPERQRSRELSLLAIGNPTGDLPNAEWEVDVMQEAAAKDPRVRFRTLRGAEATADVVIEEIRSEQYDIIHFAGHAFFDPRAPGRSGIRCADRTLRAEELLNLRSLPALFFFNACEAGRLRRRGVRKSRKQAAARLAETVGFAEALLRHGVMNYVGTYWPVEDRSAGRFAEVFYRRLLEGAAIADALLEGRRALQKAQSVDWADYIHYGDPAFALKPGAEG